MMVQDLPMDKKALEYVLEKARVDDVNITQEQGRQSLGALGLSGEMALARIGMSLICPAMSTLYQRVWHHVRFCCSFSLSVILDLNAAQLVWKVADATSKAQMHRALLTFQRFIITASCLQAILSTQQKYGGRLQCDQFLYRTTHRPLSTPS